MLSTIYVLFVPPHHYKSSLNSSRNNSSSVEMRRESNEKNTEKISVVNETSAQSNLLPARNILLKETAVKLLSLFKSMLSFVTLFILHIIQKSIDDRKVKSPQPSNTDNSDGHEPRKEYQSPLGFGVFKCSNYRLPSTVSVLHILLICTLPLILIYDNSISLILHHINSVDRIIPKSCCIL